MNKAARVLLIVLTAVLSTTSNADIFTGNQLLNACDRYFDGPLSKSFSAGTCVGYILGVSHSLAFRLYCPPKGVPGDQAIRITYKYLNDHPGELHEEADSLVVRALSTAFPCSQEFLENQGWKLQPADEGDSVNR